MSFFTPSAGKSAKFPTIGTSVQGEIKEISEPMQVREFGTNTPEYWPSGDPKLQVKITLQTSKKDPQDANDDGQRGLWVRQSSAMHRAIQAAVKDAGAHDLSAGGILQVTYSGNNPESRNPANPQKLYTAVYQPPVGMFGDNGGQPAQQAPAQPQQVQPQGQPIPHGQYQGGSQQSSGGNYADPSQYQPYQPATPTQPAGIPEDIKNRVLTLITSGIETAHIVSSMANPIVTPELVDSLRNNNQ